MAFCCLGSLSFSSHLLFCCLGLYSLSLSLSIFEVQVIPFFEIPPPLTFLPLHFSFVHVPSPQKSHWTVYLSSVNHSVTDLTPSLRFFQCNTIQFPLIFGNTNSLPFSPSLRVSALSNGFSLQHHFYYISDDFELYSDEIHGWRQSNSQKGRHFPGGYSLISVFFTLLPVFCMFFFETFIKMSIYLVLLCLYRLWMKILRQD